MNKRSMLFSLSIFLLASTLLSMSFIIFDYVYEDSSERVMELSALGRVYDLSNSIEESLSQLLNLSFISPAFIESNGDGTHNLTMSENISRDNQEWGDELEDAMLNFEQFVESREDMVNLDLEAIENKELPFKIVPHNITYSRSWSVGHVIISVVPEEINFGVLDLLINSADTPISSIDSKLRTSGDLLFRVHALDSFGYDDMASKFIDPSGNHQIQIFFVDGNKIKITLINNELEIWTNSQEAISITTTIGYLEDLGETPRLDYSGSILSITFPGLGVSVLSPLIPQ